MVSGLFTSPCDQPRMTSGEARRIRIELKAARRRCSGSSRRPKPSLPAATLSGDCSSVSWIIRYLLSAPGARRLRAALRSSDFFELHFQAQTLKFLHEHVERLGHTRLGWVLALHDGFVDPRPSGDVVALHGQQLLERVRGAVR